MSATITLTNSELASIIKQRKGRFLAVVRDYSPATQRQIRLFFPAARITFAPHKTVFKFYSDDEAVAYRLTFL